MNNKKTKKQLYCTPIIERIEFDNEISLALESPPFLPDEAALMTPELLDDTFMPIDF